MSQLSPAAQLSLPQFTRATATRNTTMRALNLIGKALPAYQRPNAGRWWDIARQQLAEKEGLNDIEPDKHSQQALDALVTSINQTTALNLIGRFSAADDSLRMAKNQLRIQALLKSKPEILQTSIPDPIFVIGLPRTGTTYLHTLMAQDPRHRTIPYWESFEPVPPFKGPDLRIKRLAKMLRQMDDVAPGYQAIHPMTAESPEECVALFMNAFRTVQFDIQYRVPDYVDWVQAQDKTIAYRAYYQQLQIIQYFRPCGQRFLLKDPSHTLNLDAMLSVFPDAKFIFTHRDPVKSVSSICSLYAYTRSMFSDAVCAQAIGREIIDGYWQPGLTQAMAFRDRLDPSRYADVWQRDMREKPMDVIEQVYNQLNIPFDETAEGALGDFLAEQHQPRHRHQHSAEGFGLSAGEIKERYQDYIAAFDL